MTRDEARRILGNQPRQCILNMSMALSMVTYLNTPEDWQRLEACAVWLAPPVPRHVRKVLKAHKRAIELWEQAQ